MNDVSSFGLQIRLVASETFPSGITITQFSDDSDPLDSPSIQVKDKAMGINGDLIAWSKANVIPMSISVIPGSEDDINLSIILEAARPGAGKFPARDIIDATVLYPDGTATNVAGGVITDGPAMKSSASSGRLKTNVYQFAFQNKNGN